MKTKYLTCLLLLAAACSGGHTTEGGGQSQAQIKKEAAEAAAAGPVADDVCGDNAWYGDGECDTFCRDADTTDCAPGCGVVVCAEFIEAPNGYCSRLPEDPCIGQDPDCMGGSEPGNPGGGVACPAIAMAPNGVCDLDPSDPCQSIDPDCPQQGGGGGSTPSDPGMGGGSEPGTPACKALPAAPDGVCSREPNDPCLALDPDCVVACAEYIEVSDGVCSREPTDPCIFQDPDCAQAK